MVVLIISLGVILVSDTYLGLLWSVIKTAVGLVPSDLGLELLRAVVLAAHKFSCTIGILVAVSLANSTRGLRGAAAPRKLFPGGGSAGRIGERGGDRSSCGRSGPSLAFQVVGCHRG